MIRHCLNGLLLLVILVVPGAAQEWAQKMVSAPSHEFGVVARGSKAEHVFELTNLYKETVRIAGVRASCGCAEPVVLQDTLKTWEKGGIVVRFNTRSFVGQRSATITVVIDRPYYAEVQLQVAGYIRSDVVFDPGIVQFTGVDEGQFGQQVLSISYAGRSDWEIRDVLSANAHLEVVKQEARRAGGRVDYQLLVRLNDTAPPGYFADEMILVTNDRRLQQIPVRVEGNVVPSLSVSPASLYLGELAPGQTVTKQLVIRAKKPFRITEVECEDKAFDLQPTDEAKPLHIVPVTFTAQGEPGKIVQRIKIVTDIQDGQVASFLATATVKDESDRPASQ